MAWLQLILESDKAHAEPWSDLLSELGAAAVTLLDAADQPLYEPPPGATPLWDAMRVVGLFDAETEMEPVLLQLAATLEPEPLPPLRIEQLEEKDWSRVWMDAFKPMRFGQRTWIVPSWHQPPEPEQVNILLDPGLAFGTGTHPTTHLCLEWLDGLDLTGKVVLDFGCGSGILAIAASLLGAASVYGIDNDPQALLASRDNAERNQVELPVYLPEQDPGGKVDILVANILAGPLVSLAPLFATRLDAGGLIALSGILPTQAQMVLDAYAPWFDLAPPVEYDEWVRINGVRK